MNIPPSLHQSYEALIGAGTIGWLVLLIGYPLVKRRFVDAFVWVMFSMLIIDVWGSLPASLHQEQPGFPQQLMLCWAAALAPWVIMLGLAIFHGYRAWRRSAKEDENHKMTSTG